MVHIHKRETGVNEPTTAVSLCYASQAWESEGGAWPPLDFEIVSKERLFSYF